MKRASQGGSTAWPADPYFNIWVCALGGGLLGYAQFPGGPKATDGVVILHSAFGTEGSAIAPFNRGRTLTHEVGHWLTCATSGATPSTAAEATACPTRRTPKDQTTASPPSR